MKKQLFEVVYVEVDECGRAGDKQSMIVSATNFDDAQKMFLKNTKGRESYCRLLEIRSRSAI